MVDTGAPDPWWAERADDGTLTASGDDPSDEVLKGPITGVHELAAQDRWSGSECSGCILKI